MPDNSSLELSKSKMETTPFFVADLTEEMFAPYARQNDDIDPRKMLFLVIVGDEVFKYPFGRIVQQSSSGSENLVWRSEKNVVQQTMLEAGDNEVVEVMTRYSAVH